MTDIQYKLTHSAGCLSGTTDSVALTITAGGNLKSGATVITSLKIYFINKTSFDLVVTGENAEVIPFVGSLHFTYEPADPEPDPPDDPSPFPSFESRRFPPDEAQDASYFAASAKWPR